MSAPCGPRSLSVVGHARRTRFETATPVNHPGPYFRVRALNAAGKAIGTSEVVKRHWDHHGS
ncbi:hypothetical protein ACFZCY_34280 [Streptomyces sp. NPDC007983]|uniref:hypothetical protein n=1 Tax=Streptomyces sp. NPDC007983 TaxID=3364800 RepID=UPI0036E2DD3F